MLAALALFVALVPVGTTAQATDVTGNWNATFTRTAPDGQTQSISFTFHFTQKGKELSGTVGPEPARQWKVEKGRLQGMQMLQLPDGQTVEVTVDAERAK